MEFILVEYSVAHCALQEPGQARRTSKPPSALGSHLDGLGFPADFSASQRSAMFPWDNAGAGVSSSAAGAPFEMAGSDRFSISAGQGRKAGSYGSRRESPMFQVPSSPMGLHLGDVGMDEVGFEFNGVYPISITLMVTRRLSNICQFRIVSLKQLTLKTRRRTR